MASVEVNVAELNEFFDKCSRISDDLKKQLNLFLEGLGNEFLRVIQDEIVSKGATVTRLLLSSFQKGDKDNVWVLSEGSIELEIGTNVQYAKFVNDGHWQNRRFIPGDVVVDKSGKVIKFSYNRNAKTGMMLTAKRVEGKHYWESGIKIIESMMPKFLEAKIQEWLNQYFSR